ncbi:MAG: helix-turn-helix domain-containing protein [Paludibacter sp.]
MIRIVLLLMPIYVTLFWSIALQGDVNKHSAPRRFLGKFMLIPLTIFISHFLYFASLPAIYPYFDVLLQFVSLMVFPMYYIYFRLLTVEENFNIKAHAKFLAFPVLITLTYFIGVLLTPRIEFRTWLFNENAYSSSQYIQFLAVMRIIIRITYLIQVIISVFGNYLLLKRYGAKAEQFYSDELDAKYNNATLLNLSIIIIGITAFAFTAMGRQFLIAQDILIYIGWSVFSTMLFIIGYMGITQKPVNPTYDMLITEEQPLIDEFTSSVQKKLLKMLLIEFEQKKIYLNSQLNIMDVVKALGTNRSYISVVINQQYNQNFNSFVNNYRVEELERVFSENPDYTIDILAEKCGFGSVNSLKRAILSKTGMSFAEWKKFQTNKLSN